MKVGIVHIGKVDHYVVSGIQENLKMAFQKAEFTLIGEPLPITEEAFNRARQQYQSSIILAKVEDQARKEEALDRVLGIVDVDIYVQELNFVFGEARCPGRAALISLWRLKPEFYGKPSDVELSAERGTKEAVHELGHTFGLRHCSNPFCVMYFSNSIFDTDRKQSLFCSRCQMKLKE
jgi:archaemetzincin